MAQRGTDQLIAWLDDAYAMESGLISILESHVSHFEVALPAAAARLEQHIVETRGHVQRLDHCLSKLGATPSGVKSRLSSMIAAVEGASTAIFRDQLVKDALADYASEQFEIACYTALIALANELHYSEIARSCSQNLEEDLGMAAWLLQHLPIVVAHDAAPLRDGLA